VLRVECDGGVARLTLERPECGNALDGPLVEALGRALDDCASDPDVRVVVVAGAGRHFCAGADIAYMRAMRDATLDENRADAARTQAVFAAIASLSKPVVARVHGASRGGGVGLVAAADVVIASSDATFAFTEVRLGIIPAMISPYVIARLGAARARRLFLTAETFGADDGLAWGLVDRVTAGSDLDAAVADVAGELRRGGPEALHEAKALVRAVVATAPDEVGTLTAERIARLRAGSEGQEGMAAFLEKRPPRWVG